MRRMFLTRGEAILGVVLLILLCAVLQATQAEAQDTGTSQPAPTTVEVRGWEYEVDPGESFLVVTDRVADSPEGPTVVPLVLMQLPDGSWTRLTPCDDVVVLCQQVYIVPRGALEGATAGDSYPLGEKVTVDG